MKRYVLKVSGHLIKYPSVLRELINTIYDIHHRGTAFIALIPGGSEFADLVRNLQERVGFNDDVAHWMAIKAMEVYGSYISSMFPSIVEEITDLNEVVAIQDRIPLIMPYEIMRSTNELPHTWSVTSDSITLYLTHVLGFDMTILAKMIDGIIINGRLIRRVKADDMNSDVVDAYLRTLIKMFNKGVAIFNARKPWVLNSIISDADDEYTLITP
ncbi:amino acid kinase family protein [Vulcanisaeta sp. JCM 14467]